MIDLKHEARNFSQMNIPEGSADDIRWAYSLYNKSIMYIKKGYEDLARQNLKKAIGLNPDFYPGRMLLGVCLFANGDRVGAMRMFNAIKDMRYKKLALSYYDYLTEEVEKPQYQSGTRLILKDLYRAATASEKTLSDVTKPVSEPLLVQDEERIKKPDVKYEIKKEKKKNNSSVENLTMGQLSFDDLVIEEPKEKNKVTEEIINEDIEIPHFIMKKAPTLITSRKNDGVVEEIVKQKLEEAQKVAKYTGSEKKPFEFEEIYKKQVFTDASDFTEADAETETGDNAKETEADPNSNILISVASVVVLVFIIITSVLLMHNITENRKLKNEVDDLKKLYIESQITPSPKPEIKYTFEPTAEPETTPEIVIGEN